MQKLCRAGILEVAPAKKAIASVNEVIVIDGPALVIASINLSSFDCLSDL